MGYRSMHPQELYNIYRRYHASQAISEISREENTDRKTVRAYISLFEAVGLNANEPLLGRDEFFRLCPNIIPERKKSQPGISLFKQYEEEIQSLTTGPEPLKPKTVYNVLIKKYELNASYSTFKRYFRESGISSSKKKKTIRIELPPGKEVQNDYGSVGLLYEPVKKKNCKVHAFTGLLSCSRKPFIQFVFTQNQESFCESFINMFEYYGGACEFATIDNLKSGVLKPDLYDPKLNPAFAETMEYFGVFVNTARVGTPKDKAKVERMIPVARELFRELKALYPDYNIHQLNKEALRWCDEEYGNREHGTTGIPPNEAFEMERLYLKPLPEERFEIPVWKKARVHPDQFVQFMKKRYSLPAEYRGKEVMVKKIGNMAHIYHEFNLIRQYVIPKGHRAYDKNDFPPVLRDMMEGEYPSFLLKKARDMGAEAHTVIQATLTPHAYLNARRAQALLGVMEKYKTTSYFREVCAQAAGKKTLHYRELKMLFESRESQEAEPEELIPSPLGSAMIRDISYYVN